MHVRHSFFLSPCFMCVCMCLFLYVCVAYVLLYVELPRFMSGLSLHLSLTKFNKVGPLS